MLAAVLLRLQFLIVLLLACCCSSLMNYDVTVLTTLCCRVLTLLCCLPVHGRSGWHLVAQRITWSVVVRSMFWHVVAQHTVLALGCPTYRPGTWLPTSTVQHTVAQHFDMVPGRHMGAQHVSRSTWLYISSDLHQWASYWLWYPTTSIIYLIRWLHVIHYGHFLLRVHDPAELCIYFLHINPQHSLFITLTSFLSVHCSCLDVILLAHPLIRTSPCSISCLHYLSVICQHHIPCHDVQYYLLTF